MDKVLLTDLKKKMFIRSSLLAINSLDEILGLNDNLSADEILLEIIKKALREFEITNPLVLEMKMSRDAMKTCYARTGWYEIKPNFTLYLDCLISEDQIVLAPTSTPKWKISGIYTGDGTQGYQYVSGYNKPYIYLGDLIGSNQFFLKGLCARPIIPDFLPDKTFNPASTKAAVYWMDVETGGSLGVYFMDLCMVHLLDYIRQQKASVQLPTMSVDVLGNVDSAYQELRSRVDQFALQSSWFGTLVE